MFIHRPHDATCIQYDNKSMSRRKLKIGEKNGTHAQIEHSGISYIVNVILHVIDWRKL